MVSFLINGSVPMLHLDLAMFNCILLEEIELVI